MKYIEEYNDFLNEITFSGGKDFNVHKTLAKQYMGQFRLVRVKNPVDYDSSQVLSKEEARIAIKNANVKIPKIKKIPGFSLLPIGDTINSGLLDRLYTIDMKGIPINSKWKPGSENELSNKTSTKLKPAIQFIYGWMAPRPEYFSREGHYVVLLQMKRTTSFTFNEYEFPTGLNETTIYTIANHIKFEIDLYKGKEIDFIEPYIATEGLLTDEIR